MLGKQIAERANQEGAPNKLQRGPCLPRRLPPNPVHHLVRVMQFITSSLLILSSLLLSSFVSAEASYDGMRQVTVPGAKAVKKRTDAPQKEEIKKPSPPPVRAASNFGGAGANNTGKRSIFDFDEEDFDLDWARRRGVKVDPQAAAKRNGATAKPAEADPFANLRKATEELSKKINMDDLMKNDSLKDIVKPIADAAATGNKDDAIKSIRQKSEELLKDPNTLRELTENLMKDPGMKKLVDQFNPAAMKDSPFGDLFGKGAAGGAGAGAGWEDLLKGFGAPNANAKAGKAENPFGGLEDLFGDLFAGSKGKKAGANKAVAPSSDESFNRRYHGKFASMFDSDQSEQEL